MGMNILEARRRVMMEQPHIETAVGNPVSFKAEALPLQELKIGITPVQDLHGQEAPYPPGGGKNLFKTTATSDTRNGTIFTVNSDGSVTVSGTPSANVSNYYFGTMELPAGTYKINGFTGGPSTSIRMACYNVTDSTTITSIYGGSDVEFTLKATKEIRVYPVVLTAFDGNAVTFYPMIRLASVTDGTFAPYSNICPISGHTGVNVSRTGVNVWDEETESGSIKVSDGQDQSNNARIRTKGYISVLPNTTYYKKTSAQFWNLYYDKNKNYIGYGNSNQGTFTTPENCYYMRFSFESSYGTTYNNDVSINYPSTDTSYNAYIGNVYPITWETAAGTVYGGTLDVLTGTLTVDRKYIVPSSVTNVSTASTGIKYATKNLDVNAKAESSLTAEKNISSEYRFRKNAPPDSGWFRVQQSALYIYDNRFTDKGTAESILESEKPQFVYELATPVTYQLSAQQISSLLGMNRLWNDINGDNTVKFYTH